MSAAPRSNRREFLQGKAAADAVADAVNQILPGEELPAPTSDGYLLHVSRRAMACTFECFLNAGQYPHATAAALAALDLVDRLEDQLSVYRAHSEVSRLNDRAAGEAVPVEPRLFALLEQAARIFEETAGAYDITSARLSAVWGFTRRSGRLPAHDDLAAAREQVGGQHVELDQRAHTIRFLIPGLAINLGSIGKGYALDRCAELLAEEGINDFLLHGGNSSVLARGSNGSLGVDQGWRVGVRNPLRPGRRLGQLRLRDRALATSGSGTQFFVHEGRRYGHILDPRTGWPAEGVLSASVLAPTAAEADALSTAFYVMGPSAARDYCDRNPAIAAVMLCPSVRQSGLQTHLIGLHEDVWSEMGDDWNETEDAE
jgi:FAD:protein FMN transferase